jgi:hypothetical protein
VDMTSERVSSEASVTRAALSARRADRRADRRARDRGRRGEPVDAVVGALG